MQSLPDWMIYGANGYTGKLIAEEALRRGLRPTLAGRSPEVRELAQRLGLPSRIFALDDAEAAERGLGGIAAVLHCAGPFSRTSRPMADACLRARTHYLDITGEIEVFEALHARSAELERAGIAAIPGSGFDVVPSDCLAAMLKRKLPSATRLALTILPFGKLSPGTAKTMLESASQGGKIRSGGRIVDVPAGDVKREVVVQGRRYRVLRVPWGDVSTAYYSTGIPDIETYMAFPGGALPPMGLLSRIARTSLAQRWGERLIDRFVPGPTAEERARSHALIHGEAAAPDGSTAAMVLETPDGYSLTADAAIASVTRLLARGAARAGTLTPSLAFGPELALELRGVRLTEG